MYCRPFKKRGNTRGSFAHQRGAALIVALLVFALAAALMVGLQRDFTLQMHRGGNNVIVEQGWAYLRGAEDLAATALRFDVEQDAASGISRDDLTELWATQNTPYALDEGGWLSGRLEDLQGRLNLNALVATADAAANDGDPDSGDDGSEDDTETAETDGETGEENLEPDAGNPAPSPNADGVNRFTIPQRQLIRLLQSLEGLSIDRREAIAITEAIADFIDADDLRRMDGAEEEAYRNATPPYRAANQPLRSVSELRAIQGVTPELYAALAPLVTVWPASGGKLNIHTALPQVLATLTPDDQLEPLSPGEVERLLEMRTDGDLTDLEMLLSDGIFTGGNTDQLRTYLTEQSDWFLLSASVEIADRELRLYSVLERNGRSIQSRYRTQGEL